MAAARLSDDEDESNFGRGSSFHRTDSLRPLHRKASGTWSCGSRDGLSRHTSSENDSCKCHNEDVEGSNSKSLVSRRKLIVTSLLCIFFMTAEIIGGFLSNSLAIMTDAMHLLTDLVGFSVSVAAITLAQRPATQRLTFGWYRAEVIGALISVLLVWAITAILVFLAVDRVINPNYEIEPAIMFITSSLGVGVNLVMGIQLLHGGHGHSHGFGGGHGHGHGDDEVKPLATNNKNAYGSVNQSTETVEGVVMDTMSLSSESGNSVHDNADEQPDMNIRAALIHILGDLGQSVGVMVAALIIYFEPTYKIADPICTFLFSIIVLMTTLTILRDVFHILMEGIPRHVNYRKVKESILQIDGVKSVHNLRIWGLSESKIAVSSHIGFDGHATTHDEVIQDVREVLQKYGIVDLTIQVEQHTFAMESCKKCQPPPSPGPQKK